MRTLASLRDCRPNFRLVAANLITLRVKQYSREILPNTWIIRLYDCDGRRREVYDRMDFEQANQVISWLHKYHIDGFEHRDRFPATRWPETDPDFRPDPGPDFIGIPIVPLSFREIKQRNGQMRLELYYRDKLTDSQPNLSKQDADERAEKMRKKIAEEPRGRYGKKSKES